MAKRRIPKYSLHKATGQARVWIDGQDHYLGEFGSEESKRKYSELIDKWRLQIENPAASSLTIGQLVLLYDQHVSTYYVKDGKPTSEFLCVKSALRPLAEKFSKTLVGDFGPSKLIAVREKMVAANRERKSINRNIGRIVRMFKWAVSQELCRPDVVTALDCVDGLKKGRSKAVETQPVKPVSLEHVEAIKTFVSLPIWGLMRFQLATGCRPGEAIIVRGQDITMNGEVWEFHPESHKTEHHGKRRVVLIGPQGQEIIREFLKTDLSAYLFSPKDADSRRNTAKANRPGDRYRRDSYTTAIKRACKKAEIPIWTPNQLRHTAATLIRAAADLDTARTVLGHSSTAITEVYAERDLEAAKQIIKRIG